MENFVFLAVLFAALCHAGWNALIKIGLDPLSTTTLISIGSGVVALVLLPLMVATGLTMSPGFDAAAPWLLDLFGGRQSARSIHFIIASLIVLFVIVHLVMVVASGPWNNLRSMITGRYAIETEGNAR